MKKRLLSALLTLCMALALLPAEALAAQAGEYTEEQQDTALRVDDLSPGIDNPEESEKDEEATIGAESGIMPYADATDNVDYTLESGAILTFDPSTGTIAKCTPNNAKVIVVPEKLGGVSVSAIGDYAFDSCSDLTSITIPDGVTTIGLAAFRFCSGLTSITIPDSITSIGGSAFSYCEALTSITIPDGVTSISGSTFAFCRGLTRITIPDSLTSIGDYAFSACESLTSITIPDSVTSIGREAFSSCHSLTNITIPDGVTSIADRTFWDCSGLTSITIPDSVTSIEPWAFVTCISLTSIKIPDGVTSIGALTFYGCSSLTSIAIPGRVTSIGPEAFRDCSSLTSITIPRSVISIDDSAFDRVHKDFTIYCYSGSYAVRYAVEHTIPYVLLDGGPEEPGKPGESGAGYFSTIENVIMATNYGSQKTATVPAEWNDVWFTQPATTYNHKLATTAAILSGAVYVDNAKGDKGSGSIESALEKFGFDKILPYDFNYAYTGLTELPVFGNNGAVSFCLAVKEIENKPESGPVYLLAIIVQGTTGSFIDGEWLNNLRMGLGTEHSGFLAASTRLNEVFADYTGTLREQGYLLNAGNTKYFLTGHSRGAAVANLTAALLSKRMGSNNVYAYTFATPTVSKSAQTNGYENIFNIVNADDFVPKLPPTWLGYSRYGIDLVLPSRSCYGNGFDAVYQKMNRQFNALTGEDYLEGSGMIYAEKLLATITGTGAVTIAIEAFQAHSMALYYSWMDTCTPDELFTKVSSFKRVNIACPVDVYVYDESNSIVASVINEQVNINILAVSVEDGEKTIDLPSDQEYSVKIFAREDGLVNYTVSELFTEITGDPVLRTVEFYDIEIAAKDTLTGEVNSTLYTNAKNYALTRNGEEVIYPDSDSLNPLPSTSSYQIATFAHPSSGGSTRIQGSANTSGTYEEGTSITVMAEANDGYRFVRWTENGEEISTRATYTFIAEADRALTAVFEWIDNGDGGGDSTPSNPSYQITVSSTSNGTVTVTPTSAKSGDKVTVAATPNSGYKVDSVVVKDSSSNSVSVTDNGDGTYTFTMPNGQVTVSASFTSIGDNGGGGGGYTPSNPSYQITVPTTSNGTVTVTPTSAKSGAKVTITATPNEGYTIGSVTVTNSSGNSISVTDNGDGTYTFTMPASQVTVSVTFTAIEVPWVNTFTDVSESDWFYDGVAYVAQNGLMQGVGGGKFNPSGTTSRDMIATILYRLEGEPAVSQSTFTDVAAGQYYTDAVAWAAANKIVEGYGNNTFGPNDDITREQMATILYRYAVYKGYDVSGLADLSDYTDAGSISSWALTAMRWVNNESLIGGRTATTLVPKGTATRAEAAVILMRFCQSVAGLE